ncbi:hypothetical protein D3C81_2229050 [compost metagenome]
MQEKDRRARGCNLLALIHMRLQRWQCLKDPVVLKTLQQRVEVADAKARNDPAGVVLGVCRQFVDQQLHALP